MFSKQFWLAALDRAARSAAQAALVILGADTVNVLTVDWPQVAGLSAGMAVASLLTSVATSGAGGTPGPGLMETLKEKDCDG